MSSLPTGSSASAGAPRRNIELKARLPGLHAAREVAAAIATRHLGTQHQVDTYFHCATGRLKLRQIDGLSAQLVGYARADTTAAKASDYYLVPVQNPETLKQALAATLGVRVVVDKRREVFLWHQVRIHLDEVAELGTFLEFEAVLSADQGDEVGTAQLEQLVNQFRIASDQLIAGSYSDLLLAKSGHL